MKQFAGTPGPWEMVEHSWSRTGIYAGGKGIAELDIYDDADEETEATLSAEMIANARLMAASKDLLEALQDLLQVHTGPKLNCETRDYKAVKNAEAAIAKALGE